MTGALRLPLVLKVALTLAATGLLPLAISTYLLETNEDALLLQVQRTHMVAASTAAKRVDAYLGSLLNLARSYASLPLLTRSPRSAAAQELLRGTLATRPEVAAVGIYSAAGEQVVVAQRIDLRADLAAIHAPAEAPRLALVSGETRDWIRIREALPQGLGELVLIADAEPLKSMVQAREIGDQARLVLATREGGVVAGDESDLGAFPAELVERARTGKLLSGSQKVEDAGTEDLIVAHAQVESAPWFVLSRQPARIAEEARRRMRRAQWVAALGALLLTAVLSSVAWSTVIRPLRRLIRAQSELVGAGVGGGSEIEQLEGAFKILQQRLHDQQDLGKVFLGRYRVTEHVGSGAMGSVFRGWDPKLRRPVALKTIRLDDEAVDRQKLLASLLDEAALSARFNHPNIVTVYDVADQGQAGFIAMEFVDGVSLDAYLWQLTTLSPDETIPLGAAIANALAAAHQHGLVHHDVKPSNVLLGIDGSIKVTDFGISQLITSAIKAQGVVCGTPGYLAPECLLGEAYTPAADLFSFGLILYEALAGTHPFFGRSAQETVANTLRMDAEPLERVAPGVPSELAELVAALLSKDPEDRPAEAQAVAESLESMAAERGISWEPDRAAMKELQPSGGSSTETRLIRLQAAVDQNAPTIDLRARP